jgi:hypothetical protein
VVEFSALIGKYFFFQTCHGIQDHAVPWLRLLEAGFSPRRLGFDLRLVCVELMVDRDSGAGTVGQGQWDRDSRTGTGTGTVGQGQGQGQWGRDSGAGTVGQGQGQWDRDSRTGTVGQGQWDRDSGTGTGFSPLTNAPHSFITYATCIWKIVEVNSVVRSHSRTNLKPLTLREYLPTERIFFYL